jgi:hypothetical protein
MGTRHTNNSKHRGYWGALLVVLGLVALLLDLAFLAAPLIHVVSSSSHGLLGIVPSMGLSLLQAGQSVALHRVDYFSLFARILVLFLALVALVTGFVLWSARRSAGSPKRLNATAALKGEL